MGIYDHRLFINNLLYQLGRSSEVTHVWIQGQAAIGPWAQWKNLYLNFTYPGHNSI